MICRLRCRRTRGRATLPGPRPSIKTLRASALVVALVPPVILSEEFAFRSKANPQSKDPFQPNPSRRLRRASSPTNPIVQRFVSTENPRRPHSRGRAALPGPRHSIKTLRASALVVALVPPVILSEEFASRSKANPQSKDPFQPNPSRGHRREFSLLHPPVREAPRPRPLPTAFCEYTMNSPCGNRIHNPRTKPVIVEDTTYGVSLLTATSGGSNFAFP
jgi:hypothetical protein